MQSPNPNIHVGRRVSMSIFWQTIAVQHIACSNPQREHIQIPTETDCEKGLTIWEETTTLAGWGACKGESE